MAKRQNRQQADTEKGAVSEEQRAAQSPTETGEVGVGDVRAPADTPVQGTLATEGAAEGTHYTDDEAAEHAAADPDVTTDYGRRAGGYVLTEKGWVIDSPSSELPAGVSDDDASGTTEPTPEQRQEQQEEREVSADGEEQPEQSENDDEQK